MLLLERPTDHEVEVLYRMWMHQLWTMSEEFQQLGRLRPKLPIHRLEEAQRKVLMAVNDIELALNYLKETGKDG